MYSVILASDANNPAHRLALPRGLTFGPYRGFKMEPADELCSWLEAYTPSLLAIEMVNRQPDAWRRSTDVIGLKFVFGQASDAILFKLTWL